MTPVEILALVQSARSLLDLGLSQYRLAMQQGALSDQQKTAILEAAKLTDRQVDEVVAISEKQMVNYDEEKDK
ncbi:hypothetical protein KS4_10940 [Poriferisphaera corsica]|uniref:Uncharacterized protein n=1 Tax=Poriferisphaera corsica TaxID=2528020 RepID=A0A517YS56_9BACT|nr:hypothetical protein KS4_10940 [Poriferisphaera corsica]